LPLPVTHTFDDGLRINQNALQNSLYILQFMQVGKFNIGD